MKSRTLKFAVGIVLLAAPVRLAAQHPRYRFIDLGTLGGPSSFTYGGTAQSLNNSGAVVGQSDTSIPDPNYPNFNPGISGPDPFLQHGFRWRNGVREELGTLPGATSGGADWVNQEGVAVGASTNGAIDPLTGWPESHAVLWRGDGQVVDLGNSLGYESSADALNDQGLVVGNATNKTPDSFSFLELFFGPVPNATQLRAVLWQKGVMQELGTLGGPDSQATAVNERGQIMGISYTNATPNPTTNIPTVHPFLWENGKMTDLGSLGGTFGGPNWLNNRGQVVGASNLTGDPGCDGSATDGSCVQHAFLWDHGTLTDLGTLGGSSSMAFWLNNAGEAVGGASTAGDASFHATLWKNLQITDLGTLNGDCFSIANAINSSGQIIGQSISCDGTVIRAVVWINGSIIDLNTFVPPGSGLQLTATFINERGEITINGVLPNGDEHAFMLIPCGEGEAGCIDAAATPVNASATTSPQSPQSASRHIVLTGSHARWKQRFPFPHSVPRSN
jgi:probable HAF family extracellular repeat protein